MDAVPSDAATELIEGEIPGEDAQLTTAGQMSSFPPYPPFVTERAPPSVADTIHAGRDLRLQHKTKVKTPVHPPPKPARPKGPKVTNVKMTKRALRAHARCLRRHGAVLTDRLERMSKPPRRTVIYLWREHAHILPAETIARLRTMLDADEPFKPDQAYEYFVNLKKTKKKQATMKVNEIKRDVQALCGDKRFIWARNATVAFAKGIQQRLSRPGNYVLADGMLRLSNIVLHEICGYMHTKTPSRRCTNPKSKFMTEIADKIAVWIDEVLAESDDRMLMMDFDEDEDVLNSGGPYNSGGGGFADDFLNMMAGGGLLKGPQPAYLKFTGEMLECFNILTDSMNSKGDQQLLSYGKFNQTYAQGSDELKQATDFDATDFNVSVAEKLNFDLSETVKPNTPDNLANHMKDMVNICSNYLAQVAEYNKIKGPAFRLLMKTMKTKQNEQLYQKGKSRRTYGKAATDLEKADGLESDYDDPNLSQEIHSKLSALMGPNTPPELKDDMAEAINECSKYLSQCAVDENERGPAFDHLISELERLGAEPFTPEYPPVKQKFAAAHVLRTAPGLESVKPDAKTAPLFATHLKKCVDGNTPKAFVNDMKDVITRCANYLSAFVRDRDKALQELLKMMKKNPTKELATRNNYTMNYGTGATETETAPLLVPFLPVKDIADEAKIKLAADMENCTPTDLKVAMKSLIKDVAQHLSQPIAMRSGAAGPRYPLNFLAAVKKSLGKRPLYKYRSYGQTYADAADELKFAGKLEHDPNSEELKHIISSEMLKGVPTQLAPTIAHDLHGTIDEASKHLAKVGAEKARALDHLVGLMKGEGNEPLATLQGYPQTYNDGARRIEIAPTLTNEKVDKSAYENVRSKLSNLIKKKPEPQHEKVLPGVVDEASKFLSAPFPETDEEKRRVLADLMNRKGKDVLATDGIYKMTYQEGGQDVIKSPVGVSTAHDEGKKKVMLEKINAVIPDKKLQEVLKTPASEGSAYLTDKTKGRSEAMQTIHDNLKKEKNKELINVGNVNKTYEDAADILTQAPHFIPSTPNLVLADKVSDKLKTLPKVGATENALKHMDETSEIAKDYIAGKAAKHTGKSPKGESAPQPVTSSSPPPPVAVAPPSAPVVAPPSTPTVAPPSTAVVTPPITGPVAAPSSTPAVEPVARKTSVAAVQAPTTAAVEVKTPIPITPVVGATAAPSSPAVPAKVSETVPAAAVPVTSGTQPKGPSAPAPAEIPRRVSVPKAVATVVDGQEIDAEHVAAQQILHKELRAKGAEMFYKQGQAELTHNQASSVLNMKPPLKVDKAIKESGDTSRLHNKFERKLSALVANVTPPNIKEAMQDVVIESARNLSEFFVSNSYKALVRDGLILEMQKRGNEIIIEVDGVAETAFFAAQRLKKAASLEAKEPCSQVAHKLSKKMEEIIRCRSMPRKMYATMKEHVKETANYLSEQVTKPDARIEAYVALLCEMEAAGDNLLIEGEIPKSYKDAAKYLRHLLSPDDQINRGNSTLQSATEGKLKSLTSNRPPTGYKQADMDGVIRDSTKLLVSYIMLQVEKTKALNEMIAEMEKAGESMLLRHGNIRKSCADGAAVLRGKNTDQLLSAPNADPVVKRKIQIKLDSLMQECTTSKYQALREEVIADATTYLARYLLRPQVIKVCKCMKNVFVQCELWCDEILRRVARPCCTCSRHISAQALKDLAPTERIQIEPGSSRAFAPGIEINLIPCPSKGKIPKSRCPSAHPTPGCQNVTSFMLYSTKRDSRDQSPTKLSRDQNDYDDVMASSCCSKILSSSSGSPEDLTFLDYSRSSRRSSPQRDIQLSPSPTSFYTPSSSIVNKPLETQTRAFRQNPNVLYTKTYADNIKTHSKTKPEPVSNRKDREVSPVRSTYSSRTPIVSTDQMGDWHAMMVSLMWNIQAWRHWIQDNVDRAHAYRPDTVLSTDTNDSWTVFQNRVSTEALQWRQYNTFSRQLTLRLALRYGDKQIVSPTRATEKTHIYTNCQRDMLEIIEIFNKWTQWLSTVIKETHYLQQDTDLTLSLNEQRWYHYKTKIEEHSEDWNRYNTHLTYCWEQKYRSLISEWESAWDQRGPVWVVSAGGAVPSGAVAAGMCRNEVIWVARTTHKGEAIPAALRPSARACVVYADGTAYRYNNYQVLCNAEVLWIPWRAGKTDANVRAVRVATGVRAGRVLYRGDHLVGPVSSPVNSCRVVIYGRPFSFTCYELLVLAEAQEP